MSRNELRRINYKKLRNAGFTPTEADRLKGAGEKIINKAIKTRKLPPVNPIKRAARKGIKKSSLNPNTLKKHKAAFKKWAKQAEILTTGIPPIPMLTNLRHTKSKIKYKPVSMARYNYGSNYTYVLAFQVKHPDKSREWKYVTIVSAEKMTPRELDNELRHVIIGNIHNMSKYNTTPLVTTIVLTEAYEK